MKIRQLVIFALIVLFFLGGLMAMGQLGRLKTITVADLCTFIAVAVSCYSLWRSSLVPFKPMIVAGSRIHLMRSNSLDPMIKLPLTIANRGVQAGFIADICIKLHSSSFDHGTVLLSSYAESLNENLHMGNPEDAPEPILRTFQGIYLKDRESVTKVLCFEPFDKELGPKFDYDVGHYSLAILMRRTGQEKWVKTDTIAFDIDENDMKVLAKPKKSKAEGEEMILGVQIKFTQEHEASLKRLAKTRKTKSKEIIEDKGDFTVMK